MRTTGALVTAGLTSAAVFLAAQPLRPSIADRVAWLAQNTATIRTVDPAGNDFADLAPVRQAIGSARMVLLGGSPDNAVVNAKFRLVRFLHEELGFDVLAANNSLFDGEQVDRSFERGGGLPADYLPLTATFNAWHRPGDLRVPDVLGYVRATHRSGHPLHLAGVGPSGSYTPAEYGKQLFRFIDGIDPALCPPEDRKAIRAVVALGNPRASVWDAEKLRLFPGLRSLPRPQPDQDNKLAAAGLVALVKLYAALGTVPAEHSRHVEVVFYRQTVALFARLVAERTQQPWPAPPPETLVLLANVFHPQSRIVVWSYNENIIRGMKSGAEQPAQGVATAMALGRAMYSIAFTETRAASEVLEVLVAGEKPSLAPSGDVLESLLHAAGKPYSFLDLRSLPQDHWLRQPLTARFVNGAETSSWPSNYDAFFSIDLTLSKHGH